MENINSLTQNSHIISLDNALYIVATPLGNLRDITLRALDVLHSADVLFCEDTRRTRTLLQAYAITGKTLKSYRDEKDDATHIIAALQQGHSVALVSDAGTPLIADPGYKAVQATREAGFKVYPIVGASAVIAALSAGGLPTHRFAFMGFAPTSKGEREKFLQELCLLPMTAVFFETPHRILATLQHAAQIMPQRVMVLARELTKMYEEFLQGTPEQLLTVLQQRAVIKGEFVVLLEPAPLVETVVTDEQIIA